MKLMPRSMAVRTMRMAERFVDVFEPEMRAAQRRWPRRARRVLPSLRYGISEFAMCMPRLKVCLPLTIPRVSYTRRPHFVHALPLSARGRQELDCKRRTSFQFTTGGLSESRAPLTAAASVGFPPAFGLGLSLAAACRPIWMRLWIAGLWRMRARFDRVNAFFQYAESNSSMKLLPWLGFCFACPLVCAAAEIPSAPLAEKGEVLCPMTSTARTSAIGRR